MADEYTDCLLENKFHENCPGCKVYQMKRLRRGFPFTELLPIWIIVLGSCNFFFVFLLHCMEIQEEYVPNSLSNKFFFFCFIVSALHISSLFPFLYFMVSE